MLLARRNPCGSRCFHRPSQNSRAAAKGEPPSPCGGRQYKGIPGEDFSLGDVEKLSDADVRRFHARYEAVLAQKMHKMAVGGVLRVAVKVLELVLPYVGMRLSDEPALLEALQNDELVTTELSAASGYYIANNRLSPYLALASAALTTGGHVEFSSGKLATN
ncbi:hypothetical protein QZH41_002575 [Actinostola sp. cb2023]|nr:hypothetical protein QZH41_002575 [Actinostola sp. cb2023]